MFAWDNFHTILLMKLGVLPRPLPKSFNLTIAAQRRENCRAFERVHTYTQDKSKRAHIDMRANACCAAVNGSFVPFSPRWLMGHRLFCERSHPDLSHECLSGGEYSLNLRIMRQDMNYAVWANWWTVSCRGSSGASTHLQDLHQHERPRPSPRVEAVAGSAAGTG